MTPISRMRISAATSAAASHSRQRMSGRSIARAVAATALCAAGGRGLVMESKDTTFRIAAAGRSGQRAADLLQQGPAFGSHLFLPLLVETGFLQLLAEWHQVGRRADDHALLCQEDLGLVDQAGDVVSLIDACLIEAVHD